MNPTVLVGDQGIFKIRGVLMTGKVEKGRRLLLDTLLLVL